MNPNTEKSKVLKLALEELRRVHDHISNAHDQLRVKALALIAGEVAIVTFLFTGGEQSQRIGMPLTVSGEMFLFAGVIGLILAFGLLLATIKASLWAVPGDMDEIEQIDNGLDNRYDSLEKFQLFLRKDYLEGNRACMKIVADKAKKLNAGIYLLLTGAIILLVIKFGG